MMLRISLILDEADAKDATFAVHTDEGTITLDAAHASCAVNVTGSDELTTSGTPFEPGCHADAIASEKTEKAKKRR